MSRLVRDWLLERAIGDPDTLAVVTRSARWTNRELLGASDAIAVLLRRDGVGECDRVATLLADDAIAVALGHAIRRLGAVLVPLNRRAAPGEMAFQLDAVGARVMVFDQEHRGAAFRALELAVIPCGPRLLDISTFAQREIGGQGLRTEVDLDAPATIIFTSGTTGQPKGAVLTHGNHAASADAWAERLRPRPTDRWLACLPLFHVAGLAIAVRASRWGAALEVHQRFEAARVAGAVAAGVSHLSLVPVQLAAVLRALHDRPPPATLRAILLGGGPIPEDLLRQARAADYPVITTYGMTETASGVVAGGDEETAITEGAAGRPLRGVEIRIEAERSTPHDWGEVLVRGPMVFAGYIASPSPVDRAVTVVPGTVAGWLHTGDIGGLDPQGLLHIHDRRVDMLVSGGENVYPSEVEAVLLAHPDISDAGVVGLPHPEWGTVPVAAIVVRDGASVGDATLAQYCRRRLAGYKVPRWFDRRDALPRDAAGKLRRRELRATLREEAV